MAAGRSTSTGPRSPLEQRAYRLSVQDGLMELLLAGLLCVAAAAFLTDSPLAGFIGLSPFVLGIVYRRLRARVSEPRIGYLDLPDDDPGTTARGMATFVAGVLVVTALGVASTGGLGDVDTWRAWAGAFAGMATSGGLLYAAGRSGWLRYRVLAAVSVAAGVGATLLRPDDGFRTVGWWALVLSAAVFVQGLVMLVLFVRRHPRRTAPGDRDA